jgi:hypothetical protein
MAVALIAASIIGVSAGHFGGWLDTVLMRIADALLAIPTVFLLLTNAATMCPNVTIDGSVFCRNGCADGGWQVAEPPVGDPARAGGASAGLLGVQYRIRRAD